ncbi:alpha/beta hydrolase [Neorhizobium sp. JUb45]|uniref:alpha/beta hydrolase n=1 Tax=unclassified Neorhizobium TaxID=2629175 RepID=UPI0010D85D16|nr:alpha/beta hydrolase [Neorhizobium sp. JUb45]TCR07053.1 acetyl esterase/lipase [Neorhizobium sp. JUb45]
MPFLPFLEYRAAWRSALRRLSLTGRRRIISAAALAVTVSLFAAGGVSAQAERSFGVASACRADYRQFCRGMRPGGGAIAACLREHHASLSAGCATALEAANADRRRGGPVSEATRLPEGVRIQHDIAYGPAAEQRLDLYRPDRLPSDAPVIVMVHGGAWALGSKSAANVVDNKVAHWLPKGVIFISVETRLLPKADPLQQAQDVAAALAFVQDKAVSWGGDRRKIVLMGHSAGAHVAMLVTADPDLQAAAGVKPWRATVALDSGAYDVTALMRAGHARLFDRAFGKDPAFWEKTSPLAQMNKAGSIPPVLLVCSSLRRVSCDQARAFAQKAGPKAEVLPVALRHGDINARLGTPGIYTADVDAFLRRQGVR